MISFSDITTFFSGSVVHETPPAIIKNDRREVFLNKISTLKTKRGELRKKKGSTGRIEELTDTIGYYKTKIRML